MNKTLLTLILISVACCLEAAEGYLSKSASGTTSAAVIFPAGPPLRVTAFDVTADNATNTLVFQVGTVGATVKASAVASDTSATFLKTTLTTNDVVILQTASDAVTNKTVSIVATTTNKLVQLTSALITNVAAGDPVYERLNTSTSISAAADAEEVNLTLSATNGFAADDRIVIQHAENYFVVGIQEMSGVNIVIASGLPFAVSVGDRVNLLHATTYSVFLPARTGDRALVLTSASGLAIGDRIVISPATGAFLDDVAVEGTTDFATTAVTFSAPLGVALSPGDRAWLISQAASLSVGSGTFRKAGEAVFSVDRGRPLRAIITGAAACAINNATVKYD